MLGKITPIRENNLFEVFENNLNRNPASLLIEPDKDACSYDQLNALVACVYSRVSKLSLGKGDVVSVFVPNGVKRLACVLALLKHGIPFVPLDPVLPREKVKYILDKTQARYVIVGEELNYRYLWREYDIQVIDVLYLSNLLTSVHSSGMEESEAVIHSDISIILPTSGSTGDPKLVQLSHGNLLNRLYWYWDEFPFGINEVTCSKTNILFIDWPTETFSSILQNQSCLFLQSSDVIDTPKLLKYLSSYKVTRFVTVPSVLRAITAERQENDMDISLRHVTCGSDMLPTKLAKDFLEAFPSATLSNVLGATESGGDNLYKVFRSVDDLNLNQEYAAVCHPMHNNKVVLWNDKCEEITEPNVVGEIVISGLSISPGYLGMQIDHTEAEGATKHQATLLAKYNTCRMNDFAYFSESDGFILVGRKDRVVKIRGMKVDITEVERAIESCFPHMDIFVTSQSVEPDNITRIFAFCAVGEDGAIKRKDIIRKVKWKLQSYMLPSIFIIPSLPLNPISRKIDRRTLSNIIKSGATTFKSHSFEEILLMPKLERIRLVVSSLIGIDLEAGDMDGRFMDVGGDSEMIIPLMRLLEKYDIKVGIPHIVGKNLSDFQNIPVKSGSANHGLSKS